MIEIGPKLGVSIVRTVRWAVALFVIAGCSTLMAGLTADETLAIALRLRLPVDDETARQQFWARAEQGNPDVKPQLYAYLEDAAKERRWSMILALLGRMGDDQDAERLALLARSGQGKLDASAYSKKLNILGAIVAIAQRRQGKAQDVMRDMLHPAYWANVQYEVPGQVLPIHRQMAADALLQYLRNTHDAELRERAAKRLLDDFPDDKDRQTLQKMIDTILRQADTQRSVPSKPARSAPSTQASPERPHAGVGARELLLQRGKTYQDATTAYQTAVRAMELRDVDAMAKCLADNGKPLMAYGGAGGDPLTYAQGKAKKFLRDVDRTLQMAKEVQRVGKPSTQAEMEVRRIEQDEALIVRIPAKGTEHVASEQRLDLSSVTVGTNGELCIVMIYWRGNWYWNPFGW